MASKVVTYTYKDIIRTLKKMGRDISYDTLRRYVSDYNILRKAPAINDHPKAMRYFELSNAIAVVLEILSKTRSYKYSPKLVLKAKSILEKK